MNRISTCFASLLLSCALTAQAQQYQLNSPDGKLIVNIEAGKNLNWAIAHDGTSVLLPSDIAMQCTEAEGKPIAFTFGKDVKVTKATRTSVDTSFPTPFYKKASVKDTYNQLTLKCRNGYSIQFRAYDDGAAYRFVSELRKPFCVKDEIAEFNFDRDYHAFVPYINDNRAGERYCYSFESYYDEAPLSRMYKDSLAITPLMVELENGKKAVIMEAGLSNYPAVLVVTHDTQLANNDMMQRLAPECRIADTSWIKPGKVAWDWWNTCNLTGVDFKAGMNTPTYKKYIDFAAENQLEYIIIDEGWSGKESLMEDISPEINLEELVAYGNQKGIGIILWASWRNLTGGGDISPAVEQVISHYAQMGIKGFKIDFFDRDDQLAISSTEQLAACAAKHHMLLDLHGLKPFGIQRAYPNILNFEGVKGLENSKWEPIVNGAPLHDFPRYDVTAPYLRQLAGPMDYTPGAMVNATRSLFRSVNDHPMSQGTRVHQMAMYTVFEAPLQMLADSPSKYMKEQECTDFIAKVPTTFDETIALDGKIAEYITIARRKGNTWFVGSMTNWTPRSCTIDLSFLSEGNYEAEIFADGINADREATDYKKEVRIVTAKDKLNVQLAPGGGWTARITKK